MQNRRSRSEFVGSQCGESQEHQQSNAALAVARARVVGECQNGFVVNIFTATDETDRRHRTLSLLRRVVHFIFHRQLPWEPSQTYTPCIRCVRTPREDSNGLELLASYSSVPIQIEIVFSSTLSMGNKPEP